MNLFLNSSEMLVFVILAIPFAGAVLTLIACLYSDQFVQAHTMLARRMFTGKSKKLGRVVVCGIILPLQQLAHGGNAAHRLHGLPLGHACFLS
jgi:hypothetical protein